MIRLLLDELANGHNDLTLKIDLTPSLAKFGDLYYLSDFLEIDPEKIERVPQDLVIEYLDYFKRKLQKHQSGEMFLPFDLSDEYIGGLMVEPAQKGLKKIKYVWTGEISGYEISEVTLDEIINERKPTWKTESEWLIGLESSLDGLNWSIDRIKKSS